MRNCVKLHTFTMEYGKREREHEDGGTVKGERIQIMEIKWFDHQGIERIIPSDWYSIEDANWKTEHQILKYRVTAFIVFSSHFHQHQKCTVSPIESESESESN